MRERISMLDTISSHIGKYYSDKWVRSNILNQSDEDVARMEEQIKLETDATQSDAPSDDAGVEESVEVEDNSYIDNTHKEEIHEAQLKMIESMTKILEE